MHVEFLSPTRTGEAAINVKDTRLGKATSTVHATLNQKGRECIVVYATNANLHTFKGVTYPTDFSLVPPPPPVDLPRLTAGNDANWIAYRNPYYPASFTKVQSKIAFAMPIHGPPHPSIIDEWITPTNPVETFTTATLPFVADMWPQMCENYRAESPHSSSGIVKRAMAAAAGSSIYEEMAWMSPFWYPTLHMGLEIKKSLPEDGVRWLFIRAQAKQIQGGRMDVEVLILDEGMDLVALSNHVCFIVDIARNPVKPRGKKGKEQDSMLSSKTKL